MAYYKFVCTYRTENECFARRLFGNNRRQLGREEQLDVTKGDTLILHNIQSNFLYGPFVALTDIHDGLEERAWAASNSNFNWQVKVGWEEDVNSLRKGDLFEATASPEVEIENNAQQLNDNEGEWLIERLREGSHTIGHIAGDERLL